MTTSRWISFGKTTGSMFSRAPEDVGAVVAGCTAMESKVADPDAGACDSPELAAVAYAVAPGQATRGDSVAVVPSTVSAVLAAAGLKPEGVVRWNEPAGDKHAGIYVVALTDQADAMELLPAAPISDAAIDDLLAVRPELTLDGIRPSRRELAERIAAFWLPDETIIYIGLATSLRSRMRGFYNTPVGARRPHSGGWFLKTLATLDRLFVHFARVADFDAAEIAMLEAFVADVSSPTRAALADPEHPWPFANLELRRGGRKVRKRHGITGARGDIAVG